MSVKSPDGVQVTLTAVKPSGRTLDDHLVRTARAVPDRVALEWPGASLSYAELLTRADDGAAVLRDRGVGEGDRVALLLGADDAFVEAFWAVQRVGAVAVPVDLRLGEAERAPQVASAAAVVRERLTERGRDWGGGSGGRAERPAPAPIGGVAGRFGRGAVVIHTSGTAGAAKAVELTHANFV